MAVIPPHPFHPEDLHVPDYLPNNISSAQIAAGGVASFTITVLVFWGMTKTDFEGTVLSPSRRMALSWWGMNGGLHIILQGYLVFFHKGMAASLNPIAQIWKEFAKGDSRYVTGDICIVAVEFIVSVVLGPLCYIIVWGFLSKSKYRHLMQLCGAVMHLYGNTIYYATEFLDDFRHTAPINTPHFWICFIGLNMPWFFFPTLLLIESWNVLAHAQEEKDRDTK
ncbi:uncharacterized protein [Amphiura filiformis]|uniref:uncharacterized protein n=1 Tax=Amphiura filiformis TaxID=82378 RepID=UPI003B21C25E